MKPTILLVDDNPNNILALRTVLKEVDADLHVASNGFDALSMSLSNEYALILLDVQMPEMDGFEVCEQLRADPRTENTPIIFLTAAYKDATDKLRGYVLGATDYLAKPIDDHILQAKVQVFLKLESQQRLLQEKNAALQVAAAVFESQEGMLITDTNCLIIKVNSAFSKITGYTEDEVVGKNPRLLNSGRHDEEFFKRMWNNINHSDTWDGEIWNKRKKGEIFPAHLIITAVKDMAGKITNYVSSLTDISKRKEAADRINQLAFYDSLTQLPNRRLLLDRFQRALVASARSDLKGALLFIDLDDFKTLNDTLGHDVGDALLQQVALRLERGVREGDTVARLGGDEFVLVLEGLSDQASEAAAQTEAVAHKILVALNQPYQLGVYEGRSTPSIGATLFDGQHETTAELLKQADIAMYQAKKAGRNTLRFFDPLMQDNINARAALEIELRQAIEHQQFQLYYQIQLDRSRQPVGAEALIRWQHPERGIVAPIQFIPLAEEVGLILPLGLWVLETACAQLKVWQDDPLSRDLVLSVNVSAVQFNQPCFAAQVQAITHRHGINPMRLKLEMTESLLLNNIEAIIEAMLELEKTGVQFALDDFGTGYSSLQYLKRLPLAQLKIDKSFVRDISIDDSDKAIVSTIIAMAQSLKLDVIAEGVETEEQYTLLQQAGCAHCQGYLFSKPVPIADFEVLLRNKSPVIRDFAPYS
ncbi:MAG: EAL domain-containing protein [Gallionella sp.]